MKIDYPSGSSPPVWTNTLMLRMLWRLLTCMGLVAILVFFVPVVTLESVYHLAISPQWVYVLVLVGLSFIVLAVDIATLSTLYIIHLLMFFLWMSAFGVFAHTFLPRSDSRQDRFELTDDKSVTLRYVDTDRMKTAVWVVFAVTIWWGLWAIYATWKHHKMKKEEAARTGSN